MVLCVCVFEHLQNLLRHWRVVASFPVSVAKLSPGCWPFVAGYLFSNAIVSLSIYKVNLVFITHYLPTALAIVVFPNMLYIIHVLAFWGIPNPP